ncbi:MAG: hypothetical protein RLZZ330_725 [Actinomycetota bacterium]
MLALGLLLLVGLAPFPYVREEAGQTFDSLGKYGDTDLLSVENTVDHPIYATDGKLIVLTVASWGGPYGRLTWLDAMRTLIDDSVHILPSSFLYPETTSTEDIANEGQQMFASSESNAIAAAMGFLGIKTDYSLLVAQVEKDKPADGFLKPGDVLKEFNGEAVTSFETILTSMKNVKPGTKIEVSVLRDAKLLSFNLDTYENDEGRAVIGINVYSEVDPPMDIAVHLKDVGGPSAGLNFTLTIIEKLTKRDYIRGRTIAVTGEISAEGKVGPIGGLPQKIRGATDAGASIMIIPFDNCSDIPDDYAGKMKIVPVENLQGAIGALSMHDKKNLPSCDSPQIWHGPSQG